MVYNFIRLTFGVIVHIHSTAESVLVVPLYQNPVTKEIFVVLTMSDRWRTPLWRFPGGGVEPGEYPIQAATRELLEETNLTTSKIYSFSTVTKNSRDESYEKHFQFIVIGELISLEEMTRSATDGGEILINRIFCLEDIKSYLFKGETLGGHHMLATHAKIMEEVVQLLFL